jgi:hypothetical protein
MSLAGNVDLLADRIADEFNAVRSEMAISVTTATLNGTAASVDAAVYDAIDITLSGAGTFNVPTNGTNYKVMQVVAYASGGARDFTFHASLARLEGIDQTINIPSGKKLRAALRYSTVGSAGWIVEAAGLTQ